MTQPDCVVTTALFDAENGPWVTDLLRNAYARKEHRIPAHPSEFLNPRLISYLRQHRLSVVRSLCVRDPGKSPVLLEFSFWVRGRLNPHGVDPTRLPYRTIRSQDALLDVEDGDRRVALVWTEAVLADVNGIRVYLEGPPLSDADREVGHLFIPLSALE